MTNINSRLDSLERRIGGGDDLLEAQISQAAREFEDLMWRRWRGGEFGRDSDEHTEPIGSDRKQDTDA